MTSSKRKASQLTGRAVYDPSDVAPCREDGISTQGDGERGIKAKERSDRDSHSLHCKRAGKKTFSLLFALTCFPDVLYLDAYNTTCLQYLL